MKCVNCEKEIENGLEQCPYCGCHYPKQDNNTNNTKDKALAEKEIMSLIDTAVSKGDVTRKDRKTILSMAQTYQLDVAVIEMKLDAALYNAKKLIQAEKDKKNEERKSTIKKKFKSIVESIKKKRQEAEEKARLEAEEKARLEAEKKAQLEDKNNRKGKKRRKIIFCKECGQPLSPKADFCRYCGTKINK